MSLYFKCDSLAKYTTNKNKLNMNLTDFFKLIWAFFIQTVYRYYNDIIIIHYMAITIV